MRYVAPNNHKIPMKIQKEERKRKKTDRGHLFSERQKNLKGGQSINEIWEIVS